MNKQSTSIPSSNSDPARRAFNPGRFDNDPERARAAGRKGGENPNNAGRFDNNPARARSAGQKGGQSSQAARHAAAANANKQQAESAMPDERVK